MASSDDTVWNQEWIGNAWSNYTKGSFPWVKISKTGAALVLSPVLAILLGLANLIEAYFQALLIRPLIGIAEWGEDMVTTMFSGALGRHDYNPLLAFMDPIDDPMVGFTKAIQWSWAGVREWTVGFGPVEFPVLLLVILPFAFLLGKVINRG